MADNKKNIDEVQKEAMKGPRGRGKGGVIKKGTAKRVIKMVRSFYPVMMPLVIFLIIFSAVVSSIPAVFTQNVIGLIES
ncbi:MAG TPA: hypothetical protein DEO62_04225, partial [Lachnospiraceae bacterium]|nr:hypothetical protein [Lachnospiraceae bacterium]HBZ90207.1 hypothetical protein [Lachnospiraceae bacterium]